MPGITFTKAYATSDGKTFSDINEAKQHELANLFRGEAGPEGTVLSGESLLKLMIKESAKIIDILSTTATSRPRARKSHGASRKPKSATVAEKGKLL